MLLQHSKYSFSITILPNFRFWTHLTLDRIFIFQFARITIDGNRSSQVLRAISKLGNIHQIALFFLSFSSVHLWLFFNFLFLIYAVVMIGIQFDFMR